MQNKNTNKNASMSSAKASSAFVAKAQIDSDLKISKNLRLSLIKASIDAGLLDSSFLSPNKLLTNDQYTKLKEAIITVRNQQEFQENKNFLTKSMLDKELGINNNLRLDLTKRAIDKGYLPESFLNRNRYLTSEQYMQLKDAIIKVRNENG
ncbi:MAG TPA: hypothetical protein PKH93_06875 [Chitinophagales bacterium]|nr:hypothetical protein [Chitinophagales bacterium]